MADPDPMGMPQVSRTTSDTLSTVKRKYMIIYCQRNGTTTTMKITPRANTPPESFETASVQPQGVYVHFLGHEEHDWLIKPLQGILSADDALGR